MPIVNLIVKTASETGIVQVEVSGLPSESESVRILQKLKPETNVNVLSSYDHDHGQTGMKGYNQRLGTKKYVTLGWIEPTHHFCNAPIANLQPVFNFLDDLGYHIVTSTATPYLNGTWSVMVWTFKK